MLQKRTPIEVLSQNTANSRLTYNTDGKVKVVISIPKDIHENVRQQKINRIYDILNPEIPQ